MKKKFTLFLLLGFTALFFIACSSSKENLKTNQTSNYNSKNPVLSFDINNNGTDEQYKVEFSDDSIISLYVNGQKIKDEDIDDYEDAVYDKLDELNGKRNFSFHFDGNKLDKKEFKHKMKNLKEKLENSKVVISANIIKNDALLKKSLKKAEESLKKAKIHKFDFNFDKEDLEKEMKKLNEELENLDLNFNMDLDIDVDTDKIKVEINKAMEKLGEIHIELNGLDKDLNKMDGFIEDLKSELVKDNLITSKDENVDIEIHSGEMIVNDKKVSNDLLKKYKKLYEDHFGKELDKDQSFEIHE